jgi:hypothetical protein
LVVEWEPRLAGAEEIGGNHRSRELAEPVGRTGSSLVRQDQRASLAAAQLGHRDGPLPVEAQSRLDHPVVALHALCARRSDSPLRDDFTNLLPLCTDLTRSGDARAETGSLLLCGQFHEVHA